MLQGIHLQKTDFRCPEEFGYYPHPGDCSLYFVCVFGGPLLESCTGGLVYSEDLQTCDWPRNVPCNKQNSVESADQENVNIAIESKKDTQPNSREPRKQSHPGKANLVKIEEPEQRPNIEAEILRNIDEEILDSLSPQPSILNTITHGLQNRNSITKSHKDEEKEFRIESTSKSRTQSTSIQNTETSFGDRSHSFEKLNSDIPEIEFHSDTSDIEKSLLASYPGESKHLDDSHVGSDIFYYTEWDDPIYDQFQDYDYVDSDSASDFQAEKEKEAEKPVNKKGEILLDLSRYPKKLPRTTEGGPEHGDPARVCDKAKCQLPDCRCGGPQIPANISAKKMPQLVVLTFDDSINDLNQRLYTSMFHPIRRNPNGCPISSTFYVSHEWTDYGHVQNMYSDGHEIASHSISHSFGEQFSKKKWLKEMAGQREILAAYGGVNLEDIRGMRAPFLAIGGNNMFSMLYEANFTYDSSMPIYENRPPSFPYTLDYKIFHDCMIPPCPNKAFPGLWEIPLVMWNDHKDGRCSMADACSNPPDAEGVYLMIMKNFQRHFQTNRAPFGLFYHPAW